MSKNVIDPWLEDADGFTRVDFSIRPEDTIDPESEQILPNLDPEPEPQPQPTPEPTPEPEPEGPETFESEGTTITLEKEKGQWKVTIDSNNGGQPQVYWGKTKNELILQALGKAQANATKKIRELNTKVKLGSTVPKPATPIAKPSSKELTADEVFEIKTQLESNPDLALSNYFQKKTGLSLEELVSLAQKGANADASLETEAIGKAFMEQTPEYFAHPTNLANITKWLAKFKLGQTRATMDELYRGGVWTVENLEEAYEDLNADGLLVTAPKPVVAPTPEPQPRPDERIVRTETRPRAGLGIRPTDVTPVPPPVAPKPPSVEDLDNLTDEQIKKLYDASRRVKALSRRT